MRSAWAIALATLAGCAGGTKVTDRSAVIEKPAPIEVLVDGQWVEVEDARALEKPRRAGGAATDSIETIVDSPHPVGCVRVGLFPGPTSSSGPPVGKLPPRGAKVKVLARSGEYLLVETEDGVKGWCADEFLRDW